jgi:hypothetical protein
VALNKLYIFDIQIIENSNKLEGKRQDIDQLTSVFEIPDFDLNNYKSL